MMNDEFGITGRASRSDFICWLMRQIANAGHAYMRAASRICISIRLPLEGAGLRWRPLPQAEALTEPTGETGYRLRWMRWKTYFSRIAFLFGPLQERRGWHGEKDLSRDGCGRHIIHRNAIPSSNIYYLISNI